MSRDLIPPPEFSIPLSESELTELGLFCAVWSQVDFMVVMLMAKLTTGDSRALMKKVHSLTAGPRFELLKKTARKDPDSHVKKLIRRICDDIPPLIDRRNHLLHGVWGRHWKGDHPPTTEAGCYLMRIKKPLLATEIHTMTDDAALFSNRIGEALRILFPGEAARPRNFFFGEGPPPPDL